MARTRSPEHAAQKDKIVETAAEMFARTSYAATSMSDLAAATGTSKARLYHYYESKEAILFALLDEYTQRLLNLTQEVQRTAAGRNPRGIVADLIELFLREYGASRVRHVAMINDAKYLSTVQQDVLRGRQRQIVRIVSDTLLAAYPQRVSAENKTLITMMLFGAMNWTYLWLKPSGQATYASFATHVLGVFEGGLLTSEKPLAPSLGLMHD